MSFIQKWCLIPSSNSLWQTMLVGGPKSLESTGWLTFTVAYRWSSKTSLVWFNFTSIHSPNKCTMKWNQVAWVCYTWGQNTLYLQELIDVRLIRMPCCIAGNFDRCKFLRFCRRTCFSENKICEKLIKLEIDDVIMLAVSVHTTWTSTHVNEIVH